MNKLILVPFMFLNILVCFSQTATISGYIKDIETGENIIDARVYSQNTEKPAITNNYGFYSLSFKSGNKVIITVSCFGYQNSVREFLPLKDTIINFTLTSMNELETVVVTGEKSVHQKTDVSVLNIPLNDIKMMPTISGETDVLKVFQLMPGVQSGQEGSSSLYVRGGSPDQNLFLIDDVPLYYVNHLGGFVSVFDDNAINSMQLIKGGFPARYGGRLSSVIDMRMKDGNIKEFHGEIKSGVLMTKLFVEGPIKRNKTSFMFSARRSNIDLFTRPLTDFTQEDFTFAYTFYDIYGKIHHKLSDKNSIYLSTYIGRDRIIFRNKENPPKNIYPNMPYDNHYYESKFYTRWGNQMVALKWNRLLGNTLFGNLTVSYSKFYYHNEKEYIKKDSADEITLERAYNGYDSGLKDLSSKLDFDFYPFQGHSVKFGINATRHYFFPGITHYEETDNLVDADSTFGNVNILTYEFSGYLEDEFKIGKKINFNIGCYISDYGINDTSFFSVQPRFALNFRLNEMLSIKAGYSKIEQNLLLLSNSGIGIPTDIWLPPTKEMVPQISDQYVFNTTYTVPRRKIEISIEAFYKEMDHLIDFKEGASYELDQTNWMNIIETGGFGRVYGLEFLLQRKKGKTTGWIAYTLSKNERKFDNINGGNYYCSTYDRRHDFAIVVNHKFNKNISLSANWVYTSGNLMTIPVSKYTGTLLNASVQFPDIPSYEDYTMYYYGGKNNFRLPSYHRLDLNVTFEKQKKRGVRTWQVGVYNAYCQKNIFFLYYKNKGKDLYKFTLFPIIPSFSYSFKF